MRTAGLILTTIMCVTAAWASLEDMIPAAKEVQQLDVTVPTDGGTIRLVQDTPMARIAAAEINSRIEELGGKALGVSLIGPDANVRGVSHAWIVLGTAGARTWDVYGPKPADLRVTPDDPGPQGYAIGSDINRRAPTFALAGSDPQGMLYAAVTDLRPRWLRPAGHALRRRHLPAHAGGPGRARRCAGGECP